MWHVLRRRKGSTEPWMTAGSFATSIESERAVSEWEGRGFETQIVREGTYQRMRMGGSVAAGGFTRMPPLKL